MFPCPLLNVLLSRWFMHRWDQARGQVGMLKVFPHVEQIDHLQIV